MEVGEEREVCFDDLWRLQLARGGGCWECVQPPRVSRETLRRMTEEGVAGGQSSDEEGWEEED